MDSHPWMTFRHCVRLTERIVHFGGQCAAMLDELTSHPVRPKTAAKLRQVFLSKGVHGTTAIEGNTLTLEQIREIIETQKVTTLPSRRQLQQEVLNLVDAYQYVQRVVEENDVRLLLSAEAISQIHRRVAQGLDHIRATPGAIRTGRVVVGSVYVPPEGEGHLRELLRQLARWLPSERFADGAMLDGLIRAMVGHVYLAWIHPFDDGNGRTARAVELGLLMAAGVPFEGAVLMANHYNETRQIYMDRLAQASREERGDLTRFVDYALEGLRDSLDEALRLVRTETLRSAWENYVYDTFRQKFGPKLTNVPARQRTLVLAVSAGLSPLTRAEIEDLPEVIRAYVKFPSKALTRDIRACRQMGLLEVLEDGRIQAQHGKMQAFRLGARRQPPPPGTPDAAQLDLGLR